MTLKLKLEHRTRRVVKSLKVLGSCFVFGGRKSETNADEFERTVEM